jgi:hypothetical protein
MPGILQTLFLGAAAAVKDAYFNLVTLLLNTTATNGAQNNTFLDSSTNNFSITRNGNTTQGTFTPFSQTGWSNYSSAVASNYINFTTSPGTLFQFTADFTVEMWVFPSSLGNGDSFWIVNDGGGNFFALNVDTTNYLIFLNSSSATSSFAHGLSLNQWNHIAMVRSGSTVTLYTNGVSKGTITNSATLGFASPTIARNGGGGSPTAALYMSNLRIVKGTAVYTSAFTPPTNPLTAISGTSLLTCQSNRFIDNSSNALVATVTGSPSVQAFSPFAPTAAYSTSVVGGSGYFDGNGDYLTGPNASGGDFGSGNFTISFWYYPVSNANYGLLSYADTGAWNGWQIQQTGSNTIKFEFLSGSTGDSSITGGTVYANQWNYVVITRSGSTVTLYTNSTSSAGTSTNSNSYGVSGSRVIVGNERSVSPGTPFNGYLSSVKLVKQANAPASIPTAPDTNTTNTSLLLNFTNAGIYDSAAKNDLETVGDAQVSTTQAKWGTTSMKFDGTGDYLKAPYTPIMDFGTGDFTIECWVYVTNTSPGYSQTVVARQGNSGGVIWIVQILDGGTSRIALVGGNTATGTTVAANTWTHIAFTRSGTSLRAFNNGVLIQTTTDSTSLSGTQILSVGGQSGGESLFIGYIDDLRITKGYARYTATFTPPAAAFPIQ